MIRGTCAAILLLTGCSLIGLDDFPVFDCAREGGDRACAPLNEADGIGEADCRRWQCEEATGRCVLRDRRDDDEDGHAAVSCGGDDCDDADAQVAPGLAPVVQTRLERDALGDVGIAEVAWIQWGRAAHRLELAFSDGRTASGVAWAGHAAASVSYATDADLANLSSPAIKEGCPVATLMAPSCLMSPVGTTSDSCMTHEECQDGDYCNGLERCAPNEAGVDARGCKAGPPTCGTSAVCDPVLQACRTVGSGSCTVAALATASMGGGVHLSAAVGTDGCEAGTLRVGWMSEGDADFERGVPGPNVLSRGPDRRAHGFFGIDLVGAGSPPEVDPIVSCERDPPDPSSGPEARCTGGARGDGSPRGVAGVRAAALEADPDAGRRRPQGLIAWLAAPHCRSVGGCEDDVPAGVEVLGAWHEEMLGSNAVTIGWVTASDSGQPRALSTRAVGDHGPAVTAAHGRRGGYVIAYAAEGGGIATTWIPALPDPPEVGETPPYRTTLPGGPRSTPTLMPAGTQLVRTGANVHEVDVAAAPMAGGTVKAGLAWIEDGAAWFGIVQVDASSGMVTEGPAMRILDGGTSRNPALVYSPTVCGEDCPGWAVAFVRAGEVYVGRWTAAGDLVDEVRALGGEQGRAPRPRVSRHGALSAAWYEAEQGAFVESSGVCPPL